MAELDEEPANVPPPTRPKIAYILSAMRHMRGPSRSRLVGRVVDWIDPDIAGSLYRRDWPGAIERTRHRAIRVTEPGSGRVMAMIETGKRSSAHPVTICPTAGSRPRIRNFDETGGREKAAPEWNFFYWRDAGANQACYLNDQEQSPKGGKWNYDSDNRKPCKGSERNCPATDSVFWPDDM